MHDRLRPINHELCTVFMCELSDFLYWHDCAHDIRDMREGNQFSFGRDQFREILDPELAVIRAGDIFENEPALIPHQLPGHDIGVMLHISDDNFVTRLQDAPRITVSDQIDHLGHIFCENDLLSAFGIKETLHDIARALIALSRPFTELIGTAMDVRVFRLIDAAHRVNYLTRLLRRCAIIQKCQRFAVYFLR